MGSVDMIQYIGLWFLILLAFNMWALLSVLRSGSGLWRVTIWSAVLLALPGIGFIAWYLLGPRDARA